jgi:cell division protein FtsB
LPKGWNRLTALVLVGIFPTMILVSGLLAKKERERDAAQMRDEIEKLERKKQELETKLEQAMDRSRFPNPQPDR